MRDSQITGKERLEHIKQAIADICYAKNKIEGEQKIGWGRNLLGRKKSHDERYSNPDNDPRGQWASSDLTVKTYSAEYDYPIKTPGGRVVSPAKGRCWNTSEKNFKKLIAEKEYGLEKKATMFQD